MRIWSLHPKYLDRQGLIALWRETLLAQKVLAGKTKGYQHHPQLIRFRETKDPLASIGTYLNHVAEEACRRDYQFDRTKILKALPKKSVPIPVTRKQMRYESEHLLNKLLKRDPELYKKFVNKKSFDPHPLFKTRPGEIEAWEKNVANFK